MSILIYRRLVKITLITRVCGCQLLVMGVLFLAMPAQAKVVFSGLVSYVTDGDTLWVKPDSGGGPYKLRIVGLDAPEICQAGGSASRAALEQWVLHRQVRVTVQRKDIYGRGLAELTISGNDVGALMVNSGHAWSYGWRGKPGPYASLESSARENRRGLFAANRWENPQNFRKRHGSCYPAKR
jgi:micrococcal nuclease